MQKEGDRIELVRAYKITKGYVVRVFGKNFRVYYKTHDPGATYPEPTTTLYLHCQDGDRIRLVVDPAMLIPVFRFPSKDEVEVGERYQD